MSEEKQRCEYCGRELDPDSDHCEFCGAKTTSDDEEPDEEAEEEAEIPDLPEWFLGGAILLKYIGYAAFGGSLALIVVSSLLRWMWLMPYLSGGMIFGIVLIIGAVMAERVLSQ